MAAEILACPYCNSSVPLGSTAHPGQRIRCPRCQELFPYDGPVSPTEAGNGWLAPSANGAILEPATIDAPASRPSNLRVAAVVVGIMAGMAAIGFTFAWFTTDVRRRRDHLSPEGLPAPIQATAPSQLEGLGYVPADANVLVGLHLAELLENPKTHDLVLRAFGNSSAEGLRNLEGLTGVSANALDHAILVAEFEKHLLLPRVTIVVRTRQPYDSNQLRSNLHYSRRIERNQRTIFRYPAERLNLEASFWCPDDRTIVFALTPEELEEMPLTSRPSVEAVPAILREQLEKLPAGTKAWAVGQSRNWDRWLKPIAIPGLPQAQAARLPTAEAQLLAQLHSFRAGIQLAEMAMGTLTVDLSNEAAARAAAGYLREHVLQRIVEHCPDAKTSLETHGTTAELRLEVPAEKLQDLFPAR